MRSPPAARSTAMHRVLRPGGRISLFEPVNRLMFPEPADRFWGYDVAGVRELAKRVKASHRELEDAAAATMIDFDDRDLVDLAERAGFERIHMECHIDVEPSAALRATSIDALLDSAPNPHAPTVRECVDAALSGSERERFVAHPTRAVEQDRPTWRSARAHLVATRARAQRGVPSTPPAR